MNFEFYKESNFKETEIGLLPEDWTVKKFGDIARCKLGKTPERKNQTYWKENFFPWVTISDMKDFGKVSQTKEFISKKAYSEIFKSQYSEKGTLLMSFKLTIGRTSILDIDAVHNEAIISVYPNEEIVSKYFLFYYLPVIDYGKYFDKAIKGNTLNKAKIANILIPLPPLSEQKAIAEVLQIIQDAKEKTEEVIRATKELKRSMMKHLFTYGPVALNEVDGVKLKETEIGKIPEHWKVVKLGKVVKEIKQGKQLSSKEDKAGKKLKPFLRTSNVHWNMISISNISYMYFSDSEFEKWKLNTGDVLVCEGGEVGRTAVWEGQIPDCSYQNHLHRVRLNENEVINYYFSYFMECAILIRNLFVNNANKTTIPNLSSSRLKQISIPLPPLSEQKAITEILQTIDEKIQREEAKKQAIENLFKSMLNELMSGRLRVRKKSGEE